MNWYVLITKPKAELKVAERLERIGLRVYCPVRKERRQWSDRVKTVVVPLLPSMVLVQVSEKDRPLVFEVPGVLRYLFYLGKPAQVRPAEVEALKRVEDKGVALLEVRTIKPGDRVTVQHLGTQEQSGVVQRVSGERCWVVLEQLGYVVVMRVEAPVRV